MGEFEEVTEEGKEKTRHSKGCKGVLTEKKEMGNKGTWAIVGGAICLSNVFLAVVLKRKTASDPDAVNVVPGNETEDAQKAEAASGKGAAYSGCVQPRLDTDVIIKTLGEQANFACFGKED